MTLDLAFLEAHRSFTDERIGVREGFVRLDLDVGGTWGVLASPLSGRRRTSWLVCHSFATEQVALHMMDVALARGLASAGFPTLRFHCRGYGDSDDPGWIATPKSHIEDTAAVVSQLCRLTETDTVGLVGVRFGATVAALAGAPVASHLALVAPVTNGQRYVTEFLRSRAIAGLVDGTSPADSTMQALRAELAAGFVVVNGFPLRRGVAEALAAIDLEHDLSPFAGDALLVQVSRSAGPQAGLERLSARLRGFGATVASSVVADPAAPLLGREHFRRVRRGVYADALGAVDRGLVRTIVDWQGGHQQPRGEGWVP